MDAIGNQKLFFQRMDGVHPYGGHLFSPQFLFSGNYPIPLIHMFLQCHHGQLAADHGDWLIGVRYPNPSRANQRSSQDLASGHNNWARGAHLT